jgi:hypothetical protein
MRNLSDEDIKSLDPNYKKTTKDDPWEKFAYGKQLEKLQIEQEERRSGKDRRYGINVYIDPKMDRRRGFDRRRK